MASGHCPVIEEPRIRRRAETAAPKVRDVHGPLPSEAPRAIALGVLLDGRVQDGWVLESLRRALAVPGVRLAAVAVICARPRISIASRLHRLLARLDRWVRCRGESLFVPADAAAELAVPPLEVDVAYAGDGWCLGEAGLAALRRCEADVWLCFTADPPRRPLPCVSRYGVWGLEIGYGVPALRDWAGAGEIGGGSPVTTVSVVDYAERGTGELYRSFSATVRNSISRNRLGCLRKGISFFRRLLERLTRDRGAWPFTPAAAPSLYPARREPTASALARVTWRLASNIAANRLRELRGRNQWQMAYYFTDESEAGCRFDRLRYLVPPRDRAWADPFAVEHEGRYFIFYEEQPFRSLKGRIMAIEVFENAEPSTAQVALERPYHLSYPFVFAWEGALYMVPETAENETIELYRCEAFPTRWSLARVLLEGIRAYDATFWREANRWWMFINVAEPGADSSDELHLYWSATPLGPWTAHCGNPVVSDARCARPAGPLFTRNGTVYRPSQDCSLAYGHSVVINRVDALSEDAYRETAVQSIAPGWRKDILHIHTLGGGKRLRVIDYQVHRPRWL
jgi:hypothetical protein